MKITPVASPHAIQTPQTSNNTAARTKAIQMLQPQAAEQVIPPVNPNSVSVEELSTVRGQTSEIADNLANEEVTEEQETPPVEVKKPQIDPESRRRFEQIARQERAARQKAEQRNQELNAREEALKAKEAAISQSEQKYQQGYISKDDLKRDTLRILADAGVSYDEVTQQILNQQMTDPRTESMIGRLEAKIAQLEQANKKTEETYTQQQQQAYQSAVKQIENDARQLVKMDPNFETIKATGSVKDVVELITQTYEKDGILLSVEDAAQQVEDYLVEEAMKVTRIGKIKTRLEQQNAQAAKASMKTPANKEQTQGTMKTLTNASASTRQLSARERALLAFKNELK